MWEIPSGRTLTKATCSTISCGLPSRLMRKRQLSRSRGPTCSRCVSRTSKAVARENQPSKAPGDLLAPSAHLGSWGQEQSRLRLRRQALREQSEVARRESGKEGVWCGLVVHATKLSPSVLRNINHSVDFSHVRPCHPLCSQRDEA